MLVLYECTANKLSQVWGADPNPNPNPNPNPTAAGLQPAERALQRILAGACAVHPSAARVPAPGGEGAAALEGRSVQPEGVGTGRGPR